MPLTAGSRLGPYKIQSAIGAGGMGEVYKACDTRLDRTVAIKILPDTLAADPQFRERFDREAKAISQLTHPHICTLYDVGEQQGTAYLVMEFLEGETLEQRLKKGALPLDEALKIAIQIADALSAAHRRGIVHRDLKPGNVMLTKQGAKLLDFGLAKASTTTAAAAGLSMLPTTPPNLTAQGTILGTFQYMAPEQLEGEEADPRTDIFAFGSVLYEMITGRKAFEGRTQASLIAAILEREPPSITTLQLLAPATLDRVVRKCLAKQIDQRWQTAKDLHDEVTWVAEHGSANTVMGASRGWQRWRERLAWALVAVLVVASVARLALGGMGAFERPSVASRPYRSSILLPDGVTFSGPPSYRLALSPDGTRLAFVARSDGQIRLWVRSLDALTAQPLAGTEGAVAPFWSPDSRFIGFFTGAVNGKLKKIDASGGPPVPLCDFTATAVAGTWNRDDVILFATTRGAGQEGSNPIRRVSASGGVPAVVTTPDAKNGETEHWWPFFLPDGRHFLYVAGTYPVKPLGIYVASLDSNERKLLVPNGSHAKYAMGYLTFMRDDTLMAQAFDARRLELRGEPVPIAEQVEIGGISSWPGAFTLSDTGILAYQTGVGVGDALQLVWFDRTGKQIAVLGDQADYDNVELSPDAAMAAVSVLDPARRTRDIWLYDVARGLRTRFTYDPADDQVPIWAPDGTGLLFSSNRKGPYDLYQRLLSSGIGSEKPLLADSSSKYPTSWSADGQFVLYTTIADATVADLWVLPLAGDRKPFPYLRTPFAEFGGRFSHDGRWIAYVSNESGRPEVYVAPFAGRDGTPGGGRQISTSGGAQPRWTRDGTEIFYLDLALNNKLMAAHVDGQRSAFEVGAVRPLFEMPPTKPIRPNAPSGNVYDVSGDGQRFLVATRGQRAEASTASLTLVVNWTAALKK